MSLVAAMREPIQASSNNDLLPSEASTAALNVHGVTISFGGVVALNDVSLHVRPASIYSIIGPNGAGKSTLLNVISGVIRPQAGRVHIAGQALAHAGLATLGVARTFQNLALFKGLSVIENVLVGRHSRMRSGVFATGLSLPRATAEEREHLRAARESLRVLGIESLAEEPVATLPYGVQKRVELARALSLDPTLVLLDEPMAGITPAEKRVLAALIREIHETRGITVVLIEHDMEIVMDLSDRIAVLDRGAKIAEGTPSEIGNDSAVIAAYLGREHGAMS